MLNTITLTIYHKMQPMRDQNRWNE